jgi:DNA modification methylase
LYKDEIPPHLLKYFKPVDPYPESGLFRARNIIIWYKPNHLPESVQDRFTKAYEPIFFLVKDGKYYFNLDAVREPFKESSLKRMEYHKRVKEHFDPEKHKSDIERNLIQHPIAILDHTKEFNLLGKNPSDVWMINTQPFKDAHFAVFPEELVKRCILSGCPEFICKVCGHVRKTITQKGDVIISGGAKKHDVALGKQNVRDKMFTRELYLKGYSDCEHKDYEAGWVLDPFAGSGTTIKVAVELKRNVIGIEIVPEYIKMIEKRCNLINNPFIDYVKYEV